MSALKYRVKNIHSTDWRNYKFMVIRDCTDETAPNDGFWYWCSYNDLQMAFKAANELCNGVLVETSDVVAI